MDRISSEDFKKLLKDNPNDKVILWSTGSGFTILREYPDGIPFIPARNQKGETDSVCMIKIGFSNRQETNTEEERLYVFISKQSKYLLDNHWDYDFKDENSPTKDSIEESKKSRQPVDLEDFSSYVFQYENQKFFAIEDGRKEVSLNEIVEKIYKLHLKTILLSGFWFRTKLSFKNISVNPVEPIKKFLFWCLNLFLGKTIQSDTKRDLGMGIFKPYKHNNLYSLADEQIDLFSTGVKIPKKSAISVAILISASTLFFWYFYYPSWWFDLKSQSQIIQASFLLSLIFFVDYIIPHSVLVFINLLIRFRNKMWNWKVKIK